MSRLETVGPDNWREFLAAPVAVLMLARSGCPACAAWTEELVDALGDATRGRGVRFGKMLLDQKGLAAFKRDNPWLAELEGLPTNVIYVGGQRVRTYAGGGWARLENRLRRVMT